MDIPTALLLGLVQGLTEFLPISSTGHLVLAREVFGLTFEHALAYDAALHFATALAVVVYFREEWKRLCITTYAFVVDRSRVSVSDRILWLGLCVGTIPVVVLGFLFEDIIESALYSAQAVAVIMLASAALFIGAEILMRGASTHSLSVRRGYIIGLFQACALVPGMSRSGATIAGGLLAGLSRVEAARFSFMLSLPIVAGVGILKTLSIGFSGVAASNLLALALGSVVSFVVGLLCIHYFIKYLKHYSLIPFAVYLVIVAVVVLFTLS